MKAAVQRLGWAVWVVALIGGAICALHGCANHPIVVDDCRNFGTNCPDEGEPIEPPPPPCSDGLEDAIGWTTQCLDGLGVQHQGLQVCNDVNGNNFGQLCVSTRRYALDVNTRVPAVCVPVCP